MSYSLLKKRFCVKDRGSNETLGKIEADFWMYAMRTFDFGLRHRGAHTMCVYNRLLFYSKCTGVTVHLQR